MTDKEKELIARLKALLVRYGVDVTPGPNWGSDRYLFRSGENPIYLYSDDVFEALVEE